TCRNPGINSRESSSRLPAISAAWFDDPVTFPPGRARLATKPVPTGSPADANTIGMTDVACFAARTDAVPQVTMTSTFSRTNSAAISARRSLFLKLLVSLVPREMQVEQSGGVKAMTTEQIERSIELIKEILAQRRPKRFELLTPRFVDCWGSLIPIDFFAKQSSSWVIEHQWVSSPIAK